MTAPPMGMMPTEMQLPPLLSNFGGHPNVPPMGIMPMEMGMIGEMQPAASCFGYVYSCHPTAPPMGMMPMDMQLPPPTCFGYGYEYPFPPMPIESWAPEMYMMDVMLPNPPHYSDTMVDEGCQYFYGY